MRAVGATEETNWSHDDSLVSSMGRRLPRASKYMLWITSIGLVKLPDAPLFEAGKAIASHAEPDLALIIFGDTTNITEGVRFAAGIPSFENAANLVHCLVGLQDNYDLDGFEVRRLGALTALVSCCPRRSAPYVFTIFSRELALLNGIV